MSYKGMVKTGYVGPSGPHLNCVTAYSLTGERKTNGTMHPSGRAKNPGKGHNGPISAPRNSNRKGYLARASKELNRRRTSHASMKDVTGYRQPGSMNL